MWAYPPRDGRPEGMLCYVCLRVFKCRYAVAYRTTEALAKEFGRPNEQLVKEFKGWRKLLV